MRAVGHALLSTYVCCVRWMLKPGVLTNSRVQAGYGRKLLSHFSKSLKRALRDDGDALQQADNLANLEQYVELIELVSEHLLQLDQARCFPLISPCDGLDCDCVQCCYTTI